MVCQDSASMIGRKVLVALRDAGQFGEGKLVAEGELQRLSRTGLSIVVRR